MATLCKAGHDHIRSEYARMCDDETAKHETKRKLPADAEARKDIPMARGLLDYFPDALAAVAEVSRVGNEQHNPGQELHWERGLSTDHADCILRHMVDRGTLDTDGLAHTAKMAWRALALLQTEIEAAGARETSVPQFTRGEAVAFQQKMNSTVEALHQRFSDAVAAASRKHPEQDVIGGFDVCSDYPTAHFAHCEGCHSMVCEQTGVCQHALHRHD